MKVYLNKWMICLIIIGNKMGQTGLWLSGAVEGTWTVAFASSHESNIFIYLYLTLSRWHSTDRVCVWMFYSKSPCIYNRATAVLEDVHARICVFMFTETHVWEEESAGAPLDLINEVADSRYISGQVTASLLQVHRCAPQLLIYETVSKPSANIRERERANVLFPSMSKSSSGQNESTV